MVDLLSMIIRLKKLHLVNLLSELTISAEPKILNPSIPSFKLMTSFLGNIYRYLVKIFDDQIITIETNESYEINETIYLNFLPTIGFEKIEISNNNEIDI